MVQKSKVGEYLLWFCSKHRPWTTGVDLRAEDNLILLRLSNSPVIRVEMDLEFAWRSCNPTAPLKQRRGRGLSTEHRGISTEARATRSLIDVNFPGMPSVRGVELSMALVASGQDESGAQSSRGALARNSTHEPHELMERKVDDCGSFTSSVSDMECISMVKNVGYSPLNV